MLIPEAAFDVLAIVAGLTPPFSEVLFSEVHLFAYLSCLLSLYDGQPVADWGYSFAGTREGSPYAHPLSDSIQSLYGSGFLIGDERLIQISEAGRQEYEFLCTLSQNIRRTEYVAGACASVLALPLGVVRAALSQEPALKRTAALAATRPLLESADQSVLYEQFEALSEAVGVDIHDLMVPAVAWLMYLSREAMKRQSLPVERGGRG